MKKALRTALIVVASGIAAVASKKLADWAMAPRASSVDSQIEEASRMAEAELRPTLPKRIDDVTTLVDVGYSGVVMTYYYRIDFDNYAVSSNFLQSIQKNATEVACKNVKETMNAGGIFRFSYSDARSKFIGTFDVKASDCG